MVKITVVGAGLSNINVAEFYEQTYAGGNPVPGWYDIPFATVGSDLVGWYGGVYYGGFPLPKSGTGTGALRVDFATAGSYTIKLELFTMTNDIVGAPYDYSADTVRLLTTAQYIMVAKDDPVITATFPTGPYAAGVPVTVPVTITNPGAITGPFELILNLPNGTTFTFGGATYTCTTTCPPVVVTLPVTASDLVITFPGAFTGNVVFNLYDTSWNPDRLVASATQPVVVNSGFAVTGTFSMQGNPSRAGIPVTFTWGGTFATYGPTGFSSAAISNNFSLALTYGGSYTITTLQPRYLNIYCNENTGDTIPDLCKKITVSANYSLPALQLRAGNAVWLDGNNIIDLNDANLVGTQWGQAGNPSLIIDHGDVNFDNKVSIQDLALVGGNYSLTSAGAYGTTWVP